MANIPDQINEYMAQILMRSKDAVDLVLWTEAVDDAKLASAIGVSSDEEYRDFHYIDHFVEDLVEDIFGITLSENEENDLKKFMYHSRDEFDFTNLVSFRPAVLKWVKQRKPHQKEAYPNTSRKPVNLPNANMMVWAQLATKVRQKYLKTGNERGALLEIASMLEPPESLEFMAWYRFKFGHEKRLYRLNDKIKHDSGGRMNSKPNKKKGKFALMWEGDGRYHVPKLNHQPYMADEELESPMQPFQSQQVIQTQEDRERFESARSKLVNRTFAIDKLLEKYQDVIGDMQMNGIEDALNLLRKKIRNLRLASSINDSIIKTANQLGSKGFMVGRLSLLAAAEEFSGVPSQLIKEAIAGLGPMVIELQRIDQSLKRRDLAREIAKVDFHLHDMQMSGLFPELSDAQSRLIEAYTYASNKIKEIIPKMRSTQPGAQPEPTGGAEPPPTEIPMAGGPPPKPSASTPGGPPPPPEAVTDLEREIAKE